MGNIHKAEGSKTNRTNKVVEDNNHVKPPAQFADNRPEAASYKKIQLMVNKEDNLTQWHPEADNHPTIRTIDGSSASIIQQTKKNQSIQTQNTIQGNFSDRAIAKIIEHTKTEDDYNGLDTHVCGDSARLIYAALSKGKGAAGEGTGIESLTAAMTDAESRVDQVFIFFVDADIVGHFFTILQSGNQATIMQGYLDQITIAENISEQGGGREIRNTGDLKKDLSLLVELREKVKVIQEWYNPDEPNLVELAIVHTKLFGPGNSPEDRLWIKKNIIRNMGNDLSWKASFAEGVGAILNSAPAPKKKCFLTTACTQYMDLPDDCEELTILRSFRDEYMGKLKDGNIMIEKYYEIAPKIVEVINARQADEVAMAWNSIYKTIRSCVEAIKNGDNQYALNTYRTRVIRLEEEFIKTELIVSDVEVK